jgi:type IV pilus assembly protein PilY1
MLYVVHAFGKGDTLLEHAAIFGAFRDGNGDKMPVKVNEKGNKITQNDIQWQLNEIAGGVVDNPVNYFSGEGGTALETAVSNAFDLATRNLMSGTAAAVTSQTRSGTGAVYQALFFPPTDANSAEIIAPDWSGQVHAFFVDSKGNMREDSNNNQILDPTEDKIIKFIDVGNTVLIYRYTDSNGDLILSGNELSTYEEVKLQDIKFLWSTTNWLNSISNTNIGSNRPSYTSTDHNRYIFTFVDSSGYQVPGPGEIQEFQLSSNSPTIDDPKEFASYLTLYESKSGAVGPPLNSDFSDVSIQEKLAKRQVDFIRGRDVPLTIETTSIKDPVRSRTRNNVTWRLGDIVTSSPLIIGAPSANYHIIYNDKTYAEFYQKYKTRRQVVYVGANDGMLHAFNGGFFNAANRSFDKTRTTNDTAFDLGAELWAYVPFNLLPHLRWLMDPEYGGGLHVPYMNLMPRAFDVRIFKKDSPDHPNGWGTILVAGMGVGGGKIEADVNKDGSPDRQMSSAYVIMDVTNPEKAPRLLGEVRLPRLGFTTSSPAIMPMAKANTNSTSTEDQWFLVFGSGPADPNGEAHYKKLEHLTSDQNGQLFIVDLKVLAQESDASKALRVLHNGKFQTAISSPYTFSQPNLNAATTEAGSFVGDPATVDFDYNSKDIAKEFRTDVVYYGTIAGSHDSASGKMYRFLTNNELPKNDDSVTWQQTILTNPNQPIVAAPTIVKDKNNIWVYFGAGRFFDSKDIPQEGDSAQYLSFFGIKDPVANSTNPYSADSVSISDLYNSTRITLQDLGICYTTYTRDCADVIHTDEYGTNSTIGWDGLESAIDAKSGWRLDFTEPWERVLGQASALGGAVFFTSYLPGIDICMVEGQSRLYGLYYKTGTAYFDPIFSGVGDTYATFVGLGKGMATTPTIHVGEGGATAFVQTSSGAILPIDTNIDIGAQTLFWKKNIH